MMRFVPGKPLATGAAFALFVVALAAAPRSAGALNLEDIQIKQIPEAALNNVVSETANRPDEMTAYVLLAAAVGSISLADTYLHLALSNWSPSLAQNYDYGGVSFKWQHTGNRWTWSWTTSQGESPQTFITEVVESATGYDLSIQIDGKSFLKGIVRQKGAAGTVTVYPQPDQEASDSFTTSWEPDASPYATKFTVVSAGKSAPGTVVLHTDDPGTTVKWSYTK